MTASDRQLSFGVFVVPDAEERLAAERLVVRSEALGLDLVGIQDHPYQRRFLDTPTWISHLAARTERIGFFTDVVSLPLRNPAVLATAAASIDLQSGGRFDLGLGAGAFWEAIEGMGGPRRTPGEALRALSEAIDVIRLMWSGERGLRYEGEFYSLGGVHGGPVPSRDIGIWLGVGGPRALELLGRKGDGWVPSLPLMPIDSLAERTARIDEAAVEAGRDPRTIRRVANVNGVITSGSTDGFLRGPAEQWREDLTWLATEHHFDSFVFWADGDLDSQVEVFAEIADDVRGAVAETRT